MNKLETSIVSYHHYYAKTLVNLPVPVVLWMLDVDVCHDELMSRTGPSSPSSFVYKVRFSHPARALEASEMHRSPEDCPVQRVDCMPGGECILSFCFCCALGLEKSYTLSCRQIFTSSDSSWILLGGGKTNQTQTQQKDTNVLHHDCFYR